MRRATIEVDVSAVAPAGGDTVVVDVFARADSSTDSATDSADSVESVDESPVVLFCFPGGGITRGYWHIEASPALGNYSFAEHMAARGFVVVAVDHLGVGASSRVANPSEYTSEVVADVDALVVEHVSTRLGNGTALPGHAPLVQLHRVAVGHSMGAIFSIWQQARHTPFDAPVFIGVGDRDIMQGDPREIPSALPSCADITLFVLADAGHNQNVAPNREQFWNRIATWVDSLAPTPAPRTA